jgi:cytochrome d ubiquinol oxidase subunit I
MDLDPVLLSRFQFAWLIGWHILMPAFTVGMASYIAFLEGLHFATGREIYLRISMFWIRIFSVAFGVGVVSGVIMPFQFGTNWSRFADATSNVLGPLFAYEGITAFFLEAAFLGVLLFGRKLVPPWAHFLAAVMVALGTLSQREKAVRHQRQDLSAGGARLQSRVFGGPEEDRATGAARPQRRAV